MIDDLNIWNNFLSLKYDAQKSSCFSFQNLSDLIDCDSLYGYNRIYNCKSEHYENLSFETIAEVDADLK